MNTVQSDKAIDTIEIRFTLSQNIRVKKIEDTQDIKFKLEKADNGNYLTGINIIKSSLSPEEAISSASEKAGALCNYISFKCKIETSPKFGGYFIRYKNGTTSVQGSGKFIVWNSEDLELDAKEIESVDYDKNIQMYQHFSRSFSALLSNDHFTVIKELHQIIENDPNRPSYLLKYKFLRHALSHGDPLTNNTLKKIENNFGKGYFVFVNGRFDRNSSANMHNLSLEAWNFMREMLKVYRHF
jgi:hypothetical protein